MSTPNCPLDFEGSCKVTWNYADRSDSRRAAAANALDQALRLRPDLGQAHLSAGLHLLVTTHDYPAVRRELDIARSRLPNSAYLFGLLASVDSRQGRWGDALRDYERALTLDPRNFETIISRYNLYAYHRQRLLDFSRFTVETTTDFSHQLFGSKRFLNEIRILTQQGIVA